MTLNYLVLRRTSHRLDQCAPIVFRRNVERISQHQSRILKTSYGGACIFVPVN